MPDFPRRPGRTIPDPGVGVFTINPNAVHPMHGLIETRRPRCD